MWQDNMNYKLPLGQKGLQMAEPNKKAPVGQGGRFAAIKGALAKEKGVTDPGGLAAWIGRKKFGNKKFNQMAAKGKGSK